jgi:hypothetical protein
MPINPNLSNIPLDNETLRKMKQHEIGNSVSFFSLLLKILGVSVVLGIIGLLSWLLAR